MGKYAPTDPNHRFPNRVPTPHVAQKGAHVGPRVSDFTYVGWGGEIQYGTADFPLGQGMSRDLPDYGLRRAIWDAAFGYVSGFEKRHILYYILTRSLSRRIERRVLKREGVTFDEDGIAFGVWKQEEG